jgi:hypothetical protein
MKKVMMVAVLVLGLVLMSMPALALELGANITIWDGYNEYNSGWYGPQEDNEVEYQSVTGQEWDLEGFFLNGNILTMVGGFNFESGQISWDDHIYTSGDIFFDIDADDDYEYALQLDFTATSTSFEVYSVETSGTLNSPTYKTTSSPWTYTPYESQTVYSKGSFTYRTGLADSDVANLQHDTDIATHNAVAIDLGLTEIDFSKGFTSHFTVECGNDNLMGASPVPEPQTLLLMGIGLLGLAFVGRKKLGDRA